MGVRLGSGNAKLWPAAFLDIHHLVAHHARFSSSAPPSRDSPVVGVGSEAMTQCLRWFLSQRMFTTLLRMPLGPHGLRVLLDLLEASAGIARPGASAPAAVPSLSPGVATDLAVPLLLSRGRAAQARAFHNRVVALGLPEADGGVRTRRRAALLDAHDSCLKLPPPMGVQQQQQGVASGSSGGGGGGGDAAMAHVDDVDEAMASSARATRLVLPLPDLDVIGQFTTASLLVPPQLQHRSLEAPVTTATVAPGPSVMPSVVLGGRNALDTPATAPREDVTMSTPLAGTASTPLMTPARTPLFPASAVSTAPSRGAPAFPFPSPSPSPSLPRTTPVAVTTPAWMMSPVPVSSVGARSLLRDPTTPTRQASLLSGATPLGGRTPLSGGQASLLDPASNAADVAMPSSAARSRVVDVQATPGSAGGDAGSSIHGKGGTSALIDVV